MTGKLPRAVAATAVAACVVAALTGCGRDVRDEAVALSGVRDAVVVSGGATRAAVDGEKLRKGDRVRTGKAGTATLAVRGRRVVLGGGTDVVVPDGASVDLARGDLLVDHRHGPGLVVRAGDTVVDRFGTGGVRVARSFAVTVAALSTTARVGVRAGGTLRLQRLYQVGVPGRSLPRNAVPVTLRDDAWERSVIPKVVADDLHLNDLAAGLDTPGATVVPAVYRPAAGGLVSDVVLADALARAARVAPARAATLRAEGASWGVVAALLDTSAVDAASALADVLKGVPASTPRDTATSGPIVAGPTPEPPVPGATPTPTRSPDRTSRPDPPPTTTPTVTPTTVSPSPSSIIDEVKKILPPTPSPLGDVLGLLP
ncbi:MAG TPA: hypothetical protein VFQ85_10060 [Mycobacteriales bacterium]|nr:hypothetical protein [Mycobacteriales bacterium]